MKKKIKLDKKNYNGGDEPPRKTGRGYGKKL
mgnify:CR=1 FL=1